MRQCSATKRNGERCSVTVNPPHTLCWFHNDANAAERTAIASKAAKSKAHRGQVKEIKELKKRIDDLADAVTLGTMDTKTATCIGQLWNIRLRCIDLQRREVEHVQLGERLEELERQVVEQKKGGSA